MCLGVASPGCWGCMNVGLCSLPFPNWWLGQGASFSARLTPLSFQGLRSALKLLVDSMEIREDFETLLDPFLKNEAGDCEEFFLRSRKEEIDDMLPGLRNLSKMVLRPWAASSLNDVFVGESVAGAC